MAVAAATAPRGSYLAPGLIAVFAVSATHIRGASVLTLLKKSLVVVPFILMAFAFTPFMNSGGQDGYYAIGPVSLSKHGLEVALSAAVKSWTAALCVLALTSTNRFNHILDGLSRLRAPSSFVTATAFAHRYAVTIAGDTVRMRTAMISRMYDARWLWRAGAVGGLAGTLFLRSLDRAERVHQAAVSRGFDGAFHGAPMGKPRMSDYTFLVMSLGVALLSRSLV